MIVLWFLVVPILVVATYALVVWARNREPSSLESGVDAFRREMTALSPDAAPVNRRPDRPAPGDPQRQSPRRPRPPSAPGEHDDGAPDAER